MNTKTLEILKKRWKYLNSKNVEKYFQDKAKSFKKRLKNKNQK